MLYELLQISFDWQFQILSILPTKSQDLLSQGIRPYDDPGSNVVSRLHCLPNLLGATAANACQYLRIGLLCFQRIAFLL